MNSHECRLLRIGWLVGILEGEGCFSLRSMKPGRYGPAVIMANTNKILIEKYSGILSENLIEYASCLRKPVNSNGKSYWTISVCKAESVLTLLQLVLPHMEAKKEHAETLMRFVQWRVTRPQNEPQGDFAHSLFLRLQTLNHRGL